MNRRRMLDPRYKASVARDAEERARFFGPPVDADEGADPFDPPCPICLAQGRRVIHGPKGCPNNRMTTTAEPTCPRCGSAPYVESCPLGWAAWCTGCYDGAPDSPVRGEIGYGPTHVAALAEWCDTVRDNLTCSRCGQPAPEGLTHGDLCIRCDHVADEHDDESHEEEAR